MTNKKKITAFILAVLFLYLVVALRFPLHPISFLNSVHTKNDESYMDAEKEMLDPIYDGTNQEGALAEETNVSMVKILKMYDQEWLMEEEFELSKEKIDRANFYTIEASKSAFHLLVHESYNQKEKSAIADFYITTRMIIDEWERLADRPFLTEQEVSSTYNRIRDKYRHAASILGDFYNYYDNDEE